MDEHYRRLGKISRVMATILPEGRDADFGRLLESWAAMDEAELVAQERLLREQIANESGVELELTA